MPNFDDRTDCEKAFDSFLRERRLKGRETYGQGLDHRDPRWNWERMALEEAMDLAQYLMAENLRLKEALANQKWVL